VEGEGGTGGGSLEGEGRRRRLSANGGVGITKVGMVLVGSKID
jgi:hypothetical protein